ncbi:unnamed protein product [Arabis nemorensis]|uniref:Uncharacterized protein n=1 Tax=Arabis nemorensis TaxID=586526 RepID=A0A565CWI7_9BRAS|nr:unnamed protein product [Arabis nemorensis]
MVNVMGVNRTDLEVKDFYNHWKSVELIHTISTPMPPPPKKMMLIDPPVISRAYFIVVRKNIFIKAYYVAIGEEGTRIRKFCSARNVALIHNIHKTVVR